MFLSLFFCYLLRKYCAIRDQLLVHLMYSVTFFPKVITKARPATKPRKWWLEAFLSYLENNSYRQWHKWAFCLYGCVRKKNKLDTLFYLLILFYFLKDNASSNNSQSQGNFDWNGLKFMSHKYVMLWSVFLMHLPILKFPIILQNILMST